MLIAREYPPGEGDGIYRHYTAGLVKDVNGAPLEGIRVTMHAFYGIMTPEGAETKDASVSAKTDANGYACLSVYANVTNYYPSKYTFYNLQINVTEPGYSVLSHSGDYSEFTYTSAMLLAIPDKDGNKVDDRNELFLAKKYCPELILNSGDQNIHPVPVEIMDKNGDGVLGWRDIVVDAYQEDGGSFYNVDPKNIQYSVDLWDFSGFFPNYEAYMHNKAKVNGGGLNHFDFIVYFEWGDYGKTAPNSWYEVWQQKMAEHQHDSRYTKGTTYAHLFTSSHYTVIQYWFFYPFNAAANRHEGDWEHVNVVLDSQDPDGASIVKVVFYYHHDKINKSNPITVENTHPIVYVGGYSSSFGVNGYGSHGSYPEPGSYLAFEKGNYSVYDHVDGLGGHIDFNNYSNIVILPRVEFLHDNQFSEDNPYIDNYGNDLTWLRFKGLWGHHLSSPSAFEWQLKALKASLSIVSFGQYKRIWEPPNDVGNVALITPPCQKNWEVIE